MRTTSHFGHTGHWCMWSPVSGRHANPTNLPGHILRPEWLGHSYPQRHWEFSTYSRPAAVWALSNADPRDALGTPAGRFRIRWPRAAGATGSNGCPSLGAIPCRPQHQKPCSSSVARLSLIACAAGFRRHRGGVIALRCQPSGPVAVRAHPRQGPAPHLYPRSPASGRVGNSPGGDHFMCVLWWEQVWACLSTASPQNPRYL